MISNILLCGVGGQGTVLASKLIAAAAMEKGLEVKTAETIGMSQRGGCVVSHVRLGKDIYSPLIPLGEADVIIAFEPAEAARCLKYLKNGGVMTVSRRAVIPVAETLSDAPYNGEDMIEYLKEKVDRLIIVDTDEVTAKLGSAKPLNVALLGAAVRSASLGIDLDDIEAVMPKLIRSQFMQINMDALRLIKQ